MAVITKLNLAGGVEPYPGYRLTKLLGNGGCGEVWQATTPDGGTAALKFLPSDSQPAATQELRALQAMRRLVHPNLMPLQNVWSCPGYLVIVMEVADGNLLDLLGVCEGELHTPLPPEHLCYFLRQAALAIDFMNARQHLINDVRVALRHCDIKPSNLLVVGTTVKVSDFSLAVQTTSPMWHSRRAGTPAYAAPEILQGWLSDRTDQYSLAASYFHLRTGEPPFSNDVRCFEPKHVRSMPDLSLFNPRECAVLARAFAPVPQDRWPSCVELIDRLSACFAPAQKVG